MPPVYVMGHRNPDTDSICAAIAYADLLRQTTRPEAIAACCGSVNKRTEYVLETAGLDHPKLITDVRPTALQLGRTDIVKAGPNEPFFSVYSRIQKNRVRTLPVVDDDGQVAGLISLHNLLEQLLPDTDDLADTRSVETSLDSIRTVLGGGYQHQHDVERTQILKVMIGAMSASGFTKRMREFQPEDLIIVAGDRPTVQLPAIEYGVRCLVVTGGFELSTGLLELAAARNVTVLSSPHDTAMTTLLIKSARIARNAITDKIITLREKDRLQEIRRRAAETSQTLFPILDADERMVGALSKSDLVSPEKTQLILVDHNEYGQAVLGAEEAQILEVIDHHRLGGSLRSSEPIRFHNEPVGSTCTIICTMFRARGLTPTPSIALCMAAGIISDTLHLTSPTTTDVDREILAWLDSCTEEVLDEFVEGFFAAGSALQVKIPSEAITEDCKHFEENGWDITIAQVEELGLKQFWAKKAELEDALHEFRTEKNLDFSCLLITDITTHSSLLLTDGDQRVVDALEFTQLESNLFELNGIVSRKKQLLPQIMWILNRVSK
jgi:manganese-dependent inorganic pyrophosphatase